MNDHVPTIIISVVGAIAALVGGLYAMATLSTGRLPKRQSDGPRILIWGAGSLGHQIATDILVTKNDAAGSVILGFVDNAEAKQGKIVQFETLLIDGKIERAKLRVWGG